MLPPMAPTSHMQDMAIVVPHDARATHDIANLRFGEFAVNGYVAWTVAKVNPTPSSGASITPGSFVNAQTGEVVVPPNARPVILKEGEWIRLVSAQKASQVQEGHYSWSETYKLRMRIPSPEDYYSPFIHGGTIIFRLDSTASGMSQFASVHLLFDDWTKYVDSASDFISTHSGFLEQSTPSHLESPELKRLLSGDNKLLAVEAFRELAAMRQLMPDMVRQPFTQSDEKLGAVFCYLMLTDTEPNIFVPQIADIIRRSHDSTSLRPIALGAYAAVLMGPRDTTHMGYARNVLEQVAVQLRHLKLSFDADPYMKLILSQTVTP